MNLSTAVKRVGGIAHHLKIAFYCQFDRDDFSKKEVGGLSKALDFLAGFEKSGGLEVVAVYDPRKKMPKVSRDGHSEWLLVWFSNGEIEKARWLKNEKCWVYGDGAHYLVDATENFYVKAWAELPVFKKQPWL